LLTQILCACECYSSFVALALIITRIIWYDQQVKIVL
jgi:hypothetical protein